MHYRSLIGITAAAASLALPSKAVAQSAKSPAYILQPASPDLRADVRLQSLRAQATRLDQEHATKSAYKWQASLAPPSDAAAEAVADQSLRIAPEQRTKSAAYKWEAAFLALSAVDAAETISCVNRATCTEHNPIWGRHPSTGTIVAAKLGLGLVHFGIFKLVADRDPKTALRVAQVSAVVQGAAVLVRVAF